MTIIKACHVVQEQVQTMYYFCTKLRLVFCVIWCIIDNRKGDKTKQESEEN